MRLHKRKVALLVPDDSLLHIALTKKYSSGRYELFFIWDKYSNLTICLRLMEPHCYEVLIPETAVLTRSPNEEKVSSYT